ncbi:MAG: hypothetical protein IJJ74_05970 [Eubacterium sp.]|nr:hypothetical protein [Eubacterium sp.]
MPRNSNTFYDKIIKKDKTYRSEMPEVAAYLRALMNAAIARDKSPDRLCESLRKYIT